MVVSKRLRRCLDEAAKHATERGHAWIGTEHLLLAMLDDQHGWPVELFTRLQVLDALRAELIGFLAAPEHRWAAQAVPTQVPGSPSMNPRLRRVLARAAELGGGAATTEHVLLGIAEDERSVSAEIFDRLGLSQAVERETRALISSDDYFPGLCIVVDEHDHALGSPEIHGDDLFVRRPSGRLIHPGEA